MARPTFTGNLPPEYKQAIDDYKATGADPHAVAYQENIYRDALYEQQRRQAAAHAAANLAARMQTDPVSAEAGRIVDDPAERRAISLAARARQDAQAAQQEVVNNAHDEAHMEEFERRQQATRRDGRLAAAELLRANRQAEAAGRALPAPYDFALHAGPYAEEIASSDSSQEHISSGMRGRRQVRGRERTEESASKQEFQNGWLAGHPRSRGGGTTRRGWLLSARTVNDQRVISYLDAGLGEVLTVVRPAPKGAAAEELDYHASNPSIPRDSGGGPTVASRASYYYDGRAWHMDAPQPPKRGEGSGYHRTAMGLSQLPQSEMDIPVEGGPRVTGTSGIYIHGEQPEAEAQGIQNGSDYYSQAKGARPFRGLSPAALSAGELERQHDLYAVVQRAGTTPPFPQPTP